MVEVGKEKDVVRRRLNDIIWLAEHTKPVGDDWRGYAVRALARPAPAVSMCRILADQARQAIQYLELVK